MPAPASVATRRGDCHMFEMSKPGTDTIMLGTDVSGLSTTAANAAAQGLSVVVPVYNEAAGLAALHERLIGLAKTLQARYRLPCEVVYVDDGSRDDTLAIALTLKADALDVQVVSLS